MMNKWMHITCTTPDKVIIRTKSAASLTGRPLPTWPAESACLTGIALIHLIQAEFLDSTKTTQPLKAAVFQQNFQRYRFRAHKKTEKVTCKSSIWTFEESPASLTQMVYGPCSEISHIHWTANQRTRIRTSQGCIPWYTGIVQQLEPLRT